MNSKELLTWGLKHSDPDALKESCTTAKSWSPDLIDHILGESDAKRMTNCVQVAFSEKLRPLDERIAALDHLELLVESADNANDLKALKLWEPLLKKGLYDPEESIREMTFWIIGTCLQNNPTAFSHFSAMNGFNELVLSVIKTEPQPVQVLKKWIYAISGCIQENMTFEILSSFFVDGPAFLVSLLEDERTKASVDGEANADSDLFYKIIYLVKKFIQKIPSSEEYFNEILSKYPLECK